MEMLQDELEFFTEFGKLDWDNLSDKDKIDFLKKTEYGQLHLYKAFLQGFKEDLEDSILNIFDGVDEIKDLELPMYGNRIREFSDTNGDKLEKSRKLMEDYFDTHSSNGSTFKDLLQKKTFRDDKYGKSFYYGQIINFIQYILLNRPCGNTDAILQQTFYDECKFPKAFSQSYK